VTRREVFAVPGNVTSRNSFGTNFLIEGACAKLIQQWQDVVAEFPPDVAAAMLPPESERGGKARAGRDAPLPADLSDPERAVLKLLSPDEPAHLDALAVRSGLPVQGLAAVLLGLEMRELVRQLPGGCFVKKL
jgi:DNA processing protein